jgi:hypothetical protein
MAITARFDLETRQLDAVNTFVNCDLDKVVFIRLLPGYTVGMSASSVKPEGTK